jgi:hypothetical protein
MRSEELGELEKFIHLIWSRTRDLPCTQQKVAIV